MSISPIAVTSLRMKFVGKAVSALGRVRGWLHLGLRGQILLLGVAGVLVVGAIYLAGLQVEEHSQREAQRFGTLERLTAKSVGKPAAGARDRDAVFAEADRQESRRAR
jgi:hypothetical protein